MKVFRASGFAPEKAWDSIELATMNDIAVRMLWTNEPYVWHVNKADEVFVVLEGEVEMLYRNQGEERSVILLAGDSFVGPAGCEHVARPKGEARVLVISQSGSHAHVQRP